MTGSCARSIIRRFFSAADCQQIDFWLEKNRRQHGKATHTQRKRVHIFAGLIRCGVCGCNYVASISRARASGYRPSMYLCGGRRRSGTCKNRFVNDIIVGSFVFGYISNAIRLRAAFRPRWTAARIQRFLLQGDVFDGAALSADTVRRVRAVLLAGGSDTVRYQPPGMAHSEAVRDRKKSLQAELEKNRRALSRLMHLFLYAEEEMSQADFLREKHRLQESIARLQGELEKDQQASIFASSLTDEEFLQRASRLLFQKAMSHGGIDFPELAMQVGNPELKSFINAVVKQIVVLDGRITQITFANGEIHTFLYQ